MDIMLVMFTQDGERRDFKVRGKTAVIGRTRESDIQVPLGDVSRRHCEITVEDDEVKVRDLGSSNGTFVNNSRVQEKTLNAGDTLTVGPVIFTVVIGGTPGTIKPVKTMVKPKKSKTAAKATPKPAPKKSADTGSLDLDDPSGLDLLDDDDENPLAELEALSKQKGKAK